MPIKARAVPINVDVAIRAVRRDPRMAAAFGDAVRARRDQAQAANDSFVGRPVPVRTFVEYAEVPQLDDDDIVIPGNVTFVWDFAKPVIAEAKELLEKLAPVKTGRYKRSFRLIADGKEIDWAAPIPPNSEVLICNVQPYARKLEIRARDGILEAAGAVLKARYGRLLEISFQYIDLAPPVWITKKGKPVPTPAIRIAPEKARRTARAARGSRGRGR